MDPQLPRFLQDLYEGVESLVDRGGYSEFGPSPCHVPVKRINLGALASAAVIGALGSIIGYLGSEVVEEEIFERLLWPERFYNTFSLATLLKFAFYFPMGGPLHAAAIHALNAFRKNNLYRGALHGHMLGTPFYGDLGMKYFARTDGENSNVKKEGRNALPIRVLRLVKPPRQNRVLPPADGENKPETIRTISFVQHLQIRHVITQDLDGKNYVVVKEEFSWRTGVGLLCSEITAIIVAAVVGFHIGSWFGFWWCAPLFLKMIGALFRVRRKRLDACIHDSSPTCMFEVVDGDKNFFLIEGPDCVVRQFFRHYGHPVRDSRSAFISDRVREVIAIGIVVLYGTIFPVGLLALLWLDVKVQFVWLSYQLYTTIAMLICRLGGGSSGGTTEERIAKAFSKGKDVVFEDQIVLKLEMTAFPKVDLARNKVREILRNHSQHNQVAKD